MTAHVAEAAEGSGRVVLWLDPAERADPHRIIAPVKLAAAYGSEVETLVVIPDWSDRPTAIPVRNVTQRRDRKHRSGEANQAAFDLLANRHRRTAEQAGARLGVIVRHARAPGDAVDRIAEMCLERGPWNIIALSRAITATSPFLINDLLANVSGATGVLVAGREPRTGRERRLAVVAEDADRLPSMLRAAGRLAGDTGMIHLLIGTETSAETAELEAHARLIIRGMRGVTFEPAEPTYGVSGVVAERIRQLEPGLVIARYGGTAFPDGRELARTAAITPSLFLLIR